MMQYITVSLIHREKLETPVVFLICQVIKQAVVKVTGSAVMVHITGQ